MPENLAFTTRLIKRLQDLSGRPKDPFIEVGVEYLRPLNRIIMDEARGCFWVILPSGPPQVATFLPLWEPVQSGE